MKKIINDYKLYKTLSKFILRESGKNSLKRGQRKNLPSIFTPITPNFRYETTKVHHAGNTKRATQVGTVLLRHISEFISSGELNPEIAELGVDISKIKVMPDFSAVVVSWHARGNEDDHKIHLLLQQYSAKLRSLLIGRRLLSHIPTISFKMDTTNSAVLEVEKLLQIADFGPDFERHSHKTQGYGEQLSGDMISTYGRLSATQQSSRNTNHKCDGSNILDKYAGNSAHQRNIYSVDRDLMMEKVKKLMNKSKDRSINMDNKFTDCGNNLSKIHKNKIKKPNRDTFIENNEDFDYDSNSVEDDDIDE